MTRRPRSAAAAAAIVLAVSGLSACGFDAQTDKILADNAQGSTPKGGIVARALVLVKSPNAIAAALAGSLINNGTTSDTLESIRLTPDGEAGAQAIVVQPNEVIEPKTVLQLGTAGHEPITVPNAQNLKLGHFVDLLLHFKNAGDIKVQVETHKREGFYSDVLPAATGTTTTQADAARRTKKPTTTTSTSRASTATGTATTSTDTTGTATTDAALTGADGTAVTKSSTTTAPTAKATRAKRAAKKAKARAAKVAAAKAAQAAPTAPTAPSVDPAAVDAPVHSGH